MMNKKVIWGAGIYGNRFYSTIDKEEIAFFIDSDRSKLNLLIDSKPIIHPDEVDNWKELIVYVPYNYFNEIVDILREKGVDEGNIIKYNSTNFVSIDRIQSDFNERVCQLEEKKDLFSGKVIFWGGVWSYSQNYKRFLIDFIDNNKGKVAYVGENVMTNEIEVDTVLAPIICEDRLLFTNGYLSDDEKSLIDKIEYLGECVEQLLESSKGNSLESAQYAVYKMYKYFFVLIKKIKPQMIISQNSVRVASIILDNLCREEGVTIFYSHEGILPGTLSIDKFGEMGKSLPAVYSDKFLKLHVSEENLSHARKVWDYLIESEINRKKQPTKQYVDIELDKKRPTIFFAGQNDPLSHMIPYTEETKKYYSPDFRSTEEAAKYIAELCRNNGWNYIFKPHPNYIIGDSLKSIYPEMNYIEFANINYLIDISDVVVTILSQTNYVALIRKKPVVMLGYTQSKGKGFTYEAFEKRFIEEKIRRALEMGFTVEMQEQFVKHIAQVNEYYLYDDKSKRKIRYGRDFPETEKDLNYLNELLSNG